MAAIDRFLKFAVQSGASDLHLTPAREPTVRLHGTLRKLNMPQLQRHQPQNRPRQQLHLPEGDRTAPDGLPAPLRAWDRHTADGVSHFIGPTFD